MQHDKTIVLQTFFRSHRGKGNAEQTGRTWHSLHLSQMKMCLAWIPVSGIELKIFEKDKEAALKLIISIS
jgi:hypothetical protein